MSRRCFNVFTSTSKDYFFTDNSLTARGWLTCNDFISSLTTSILKQRVSNYKHSTVCYYVMYAFQSESTLSICLNVKELLT